MIVACLTDFIKYLKFERRYSQHTLLAYEKDLLQFQSYIEEQFELADEAELKHFHVRSWLAEMKDDKQSARTINRKLSSLNSYYKYLMRLGKADKNPVQLLHAQKLPERLPAYLKEHEATNMLEEVDFDPGFKGFTDRMICSILYQTGMRRSELLQLKEQDIEWSLKQVRILGKGNKERLVPIGAQLQQDMRDLTIQSRIGEPEHCRLIVARRP